MSREIKFRAWYPAKEVMLHDFGFYPSDGGYVFVSESDQQSLDEAVIASGDQYEELVYFHNVTIMQYTGLKDKNGREIYEGDILGKRPFGYFKADGTKDGRYNGKEWYCFAVEWGEYDPSEHGMVGGYEYEIDGHYVGWNINVGGYDDETKDHEVIGNIYENPELLK